MKDKCIGLWGKVFGHNYKPLFEEEKNTMEAPIRLRTSAPSP